MDRPVKGSRQRVNEEGFTLLEMMIVVAIIGVTATLGVTNFGVWKARADLKAAVTTMQNELTVARMMAMNRNIPVAVTITVAPTVLTVTTANANTAAVLATSNHSISHVANVFNQLAPGPPPVFVQVPTTTIMFNSLGMRLPETGGNQVIAISNDRGMQYTLRVTPRGSAAWCASIYCQGTH